MSNERRWSEALVHHIVDGNASNKILQTPMVDSIIHDKIIRRFRKDGWYSIKSAYLNCIIVPVDLGSS